MCVERGGHGSTHSGARVLLDQRVREPARHKDRGPIATLAVAERSLERVGGLAVSSSPGAMHVGP